MSSPNPSSPSPSEPAASPLLQQPPPPMVRPSPDSRLEQLTARYDQAKQREKEAKAEADQITAAIKAELAKLHPGAPEVLLHSPYLSAPLQLRAVDSWRFDSKGCKASHPQIYAAFAKRSTSWRLARMEG